MRNEGLTIVELILVVVIISLLAAITVPVFQSSIPKITLESEARKTISEIRKVQQQAISSNTTYLILFNVGTDTLEISYLDEDNDEQFSYSYTLDKSVKFTGTGFAGNTLQFDLLGGPSEGGDITIRNSVENQLTIRVAPSTGKISLIK